MTSQRGSTASSTEPLWWAPYEAVLEGGWIAWSGSVIERIVLPGSSMPPGLKVKTAPGSARLALRLSAYVDGTSAWSRRAEFIDSAASSPFEAEVFCTTAIRRGETMTCAEVATQVGRSGAVRAVGAPTAKNRFAPMISAIGWSGAKGRWAATPGGRR